MYKQNEVAILIKEVIAGSIIINEGELFMST